MDFRPMSEKPQYGCLCLLRRLDPNGVRPGSDYFSPTWEYRLAEWVPFYQEGGEFGAIIGKYGNYWCGGPDDIDTCFTEAEDENGYDWTEWMELPQPPERK